MEAKKSRTDRHRGRRRWSKIAEICLQNSMRLVIWVFKGGVMVKEKRNRGKTGDDVERGKREERRGRNSAGAAFSATTGVIVGGVATSGPAVSAGGAAAGGLAAYGTGLGVTIGAIGCEAAAVGTLAVVAAGPILGGLIAYTGYKAIQNMRRKDA